MRRRDRHPQTGGQEDGQSCGAGNGDQEVRIARKRVRDQSFPGERPGQRAAHEQSHHGAGEGGHCGIAERPAESGGTAPEQSGDALEVVVRAVREGDDKDRKEQEDHRYCLHTRPGSAPIGNGTVSAAAGSLQLRNVSQFLVLPLRDIGGLDSRQACNVHEINETNQRVLVRRTRSRVRQGTRAPPAVAPWADADLQSNDRSRDRVPGGKVVACATPALSASPGNVPALPAVPVSDEYDDSGSGASAPRISARTAGGTPAAFPRLEGVRIHDLGRDNRARSRAG